MSTATEEHRHLRKTREGTVIGNQMDKTLVVRVDRRVRHKLYSKEITRSKKLYAHDENNEASVGDVVRVMETRPVSKLKRWRLVEVVRKAKG